MSSTDDLPTAAASTTASTSPSSPSSPSSTDVAVADDPLAALLGELQAALGEAVVDTLHKPGDDLWIRVRSDAWVQVGEAMKALGFDYFCYLSVLDWMPSPYGRGEDDPTEPPPVRETTIRPGYTGGDTRFQILARLVSPTRHLGVTLKVDVPDGPEPEMPTWVGIYAGANWHEREAWEMFGIRFGGHPDLRHLYLPSDFESYPLRKDFPLLARMVKPWPGIVDVEPMPADLDADAEPAADGEAADGAEGGAG